ncbi:MAG: hypothetical protein M3Z04_03470 [Chloroflexota bacterium]|nr:hypothetical protein [Chloroflexota bacterium]
MAGEVNARALRVVLQDDQRAGWPVRVVAVEGTALGAPHCRVLLYLLRKA